MHKIVKMTQEMITRYGHMNGDHDTNHYSDDYAKTQGYAGAIVHGLFLSGIAIGMAVQKHGGAFHVRGEFEHKYVAGTCAGDELMLTIAEDDTITARVGDKTTMTGYARLRTE
jgi:acyl dehydratase